MTGLRVEPSIDGLVILGPTAQKAYDSLDEKNRELVDADICHFVTRVLALMRFQTIPELPGEHGIECLADFILDSPPCSIDVVMQNTFFTVIRTLIRPTMTITEILIVQ